MKCPIDNGSSVEAEKAEYTTSNSFFQWNSW